MVDKMNTTELFEKNKIEYMRQLRIIKKNLIHIHGIPKSIAIINLLKTEKYLGQYGKIIRFILSYKINQENNKKFYSAYITYSNELEAALAILCIDSLLIEGKIIRAFFGTTKYCNHFLNKSKCPNLEHCIYLHQLISDNDIIIDNNKNNVFSYNEHLKLAKKIVTDSNIKEKYLFQKTEKTEKNVFPSINFIFLNEEEKEKYFATGNIAYIRTNNINHDNVSLNHFNSPKKDLISNKDSYNIERKKILLDGSVGISNSNLSIIKNKEKSEYLSSKNLFEDKNNNLDSLTSIQLHNIFHNSLNKILDRKPFYMALKNVNLQKIELEYFIKDLSKNGVNIYEILNGCLDPVNHLI